MTSPYKKRAKGSWNQGKRCKGDSEERAFSRREVADQLAEAEDDFLHRHKKAPRRNQRARLEYRVAWYEQALSARKGRDDSFTGHLTRGLRESRKELRELDVREGKTLYSGTCDTCGDASDKLQINARLGILWCPACY